MDILLLILSVLGVLAAGSVWFRWRPRGGLTFVQFLTGWLVGELALQVMTLQMLVTVGLATLGALQTPLGLAGLACAGLAWLLLTASHVRALGARAEVRALAAAHDLDVSVADVSPLHGYLRPFNMRTPAVQVTRDVAYGPSLPGDRGGRNLLNVVQPAAAGTLRPILLQVHGGAWILGDKNEQGLPLMNHMAAAGWVCFSSNYRLSPQATFPDHIVDVKRALVWIREHAAEYGGDPDFICITGGSAGGHLAALAALTPNDPQFQPGFEAADTRIAAAVPFYGAYDWLDRAGNRPNHSMQAFLAERVLKCTPQQNPDLWDAACPVAHVNADAPPFLAIQGSHDSLVFVEEARSFVDTLQARSQQPVMYLELRGGQHAFDCFHSVRSACAVRAAGGFLRKMHAAQVGSVRSVAA